MQRWLSRLLFWAGCTFVGAAPPVHGEMAEEMLQFPTDSAAGHLFPVNPAVLKPSGQSAGALTAHQSRESSFDHTAVGGDIIDAQVSEDVLGAAYTSDLGAGASFGLSQVEHFRKVETALSDRSGTNITEAIANTETSAKLIVELTSELRAAVVLRYLHRDATVWGDPELRGDMETRYHLSLVGYGSGFTYTLPSGGIGYTYYPPLHGKTEVYGEERITYEPGQIALDAYFRPQGLGGPWTVGILAKRWLSEVDDLASGTTAADNRSRISLYGLDPDQYLVRQQLIMVGGDYAFTKQALLRLALGQEVDSFDFQDYFIFPRADVKHGSGSDQLKTTRMRAALRLSKEGARGASVDLGMGLYSRQINFSAAENSGSYTLKNGKEIYATVAVQL